ncbi:(2Fe-2S)-binding protein, partial [Burkholderia pseudomallei]
ASRCGVERPAAVPVAVTFYERMAA